MAQTITFRDAQMETGKLIIDLPPDQRGTVMHWMKTRKDKDYDLTIKEHREQRTNDANKMLWALLNEMAVLLRLPPEEIYQGYIPDVGDNFTWHPEKPENVDRFINGWCKGHIGRMVDDVGPCRSTELNGYRLLKCYYGSSEYDTKTFSRLLDLVLQDCRNLGIPTMSEREKSLLLDEWEATRNA